MANQEHDAFALPTAYRLDGYEVMRVLGYGGFGITYLAQDLESGERVAIKEYYPSDLAVRLENGRVAPKAEEDREVFDWGLDRFVDEARTLARFSHPNIVGVQRFLALNDTAYMVMDYQHGVPLGEILDEHGDLEESEVLELVPPLLDGLAAVHEAEVLHRDIKPDNIYIRVDGTPVLLDFGAARLEVGHKSKSLHRVFTPGYGAPEQYEAGGEQGPWTDIYGMAAVLYSAISGRAPLEAPARTGSFVRTQQDALEPARQVGRGRFAPGFLEAIDWGLEIDQGRRPQNVAVWRDALMAPYSEQASQLTGKSTLLRARADEAEAVSPETLLAGRQTTVKAGGPLAAGQRETGSGWRRRRIGLIAACVTLLVVCGGVLGWVLVQNQNEQSKQALAAAAEREADKRREEARAARQREAARKAAQEAEERRRRDEALKPAKPIVWNVGGAKSHDSASLAHALENAPDGATIKLHRSHIRGRYRLARRLVLMGTGTRGGKTTLSCRNGPCVVFVGDSQIFNVHIYRYRGDDPGPALLVRGGKVDIRASWISSRAGAGIVVRGGSLFVWQSMIYSNFGQGIVIRPNVGAVRLLANVIRENRFAGILLNTNKSVSIVRNRIYKSRHGVVIRRGKAVMLKNNVYENTGYGIRIHPTGLLDDQGNDLRDNVRGNVRRDQKPPSPQ